MVAWYLYIPIFLALHYFTKHFLHKLQNLPPTPFFSLPIIGHLYLLKKPLHKTLSTLSKRYGPIFFLHLGYRRTLIISSPSLVEECFTKNDIIFANRPNLATGKHLGYNYTSIVWASYGDHWRNLRRIASLELLSTPRLLALADVRADEAKRLIQKLLNHQESQVVEVKNLLFELTMNVMTRVMVGKRFCGENLVDSEQAKKFRDMNDELFYLSLKPNMGDFVTWLRSKELDKKLMECQGKRDEFIQSLIEEKRKLMDKDKDKNKSKTMIEVLLSLQETEPECYTDEIIRGLVLNLFVGGTETTTNTMEWALSHLLNDPDIIVKAQAEIDNNIGHDRLVTEADLTKLPYLRCIINETMRMNPAVPLLLPHMASKDCQVGGYKVTRGTMLSVNLWSIQNDPDIWVEPNKFNPDRFKGVTEGARDGFRSMPFGSGRRSCPGEGLALRTMGLTLGLMLQCFDWERVGEELVDLSEGIGFTLPKAQPLQATCKPRPCLLKLISQL